MWGCFNNLRNRVFSDILASHRISSQKPGFSLPTHHLRNRVFSDIFASNRISSQKPGFSLPTHHLRNRVFSDIFASNQISSQKPGFSPPPTISETGFFPISSHPIEYLRKNPVSRYHVQSQKPGFFRYLRLASNIFAKTRFLATRAQPW